MSIVYEKNDRVLKLRPIECIYRYDNKLIFYIVEGKEIYAYDDKNECIEILDLMAETSLWLFLTCIEIDKKLYFIPYFAMNMIEYHLETGEFERIPIRSRSTDAKYHKVSFFNGKLHLFPFIGNDILIYDIDNKEKKVCKFEIEEEQHEQPFFLNIYVCEHRVWSVTGRDSNIYCYNMVSLQTDIYALNGNGNSIIDITGEDNELFLLTSDGSVFAWNNESKMERMIIRSNEKGGEPYIAIRCFSGLLGLIPNNYNCVRIIDLYGRLVTEWDFSYLKKGNHPLFEAVVQQDNLLFLSPFYSEKLVIIDLQECLFEIVEIKDIRQDLVHRIDALMNENVIGTRRMIGAHIWDQIKKVIE